MAIQLYRKGEQHEIRGFMVDVQNVNDAYGALKQGWFFSPEEAYADEKSPLDVDPLPEKKEPKKKRPYKKRTPKT
jgi:hypothetical protein